MKTVLHVQTILAIVHLVHYPHFIILILLLMLEAAMKPVLLQPINKTIHVYLALPLALIVNHYLYVLTVVLDIFCIRVLA